MVNFDKETKEIVIFDGDIEYSIDLEECHSTGEILDHIFQIHNKNWCTDTILKQVCECFEDACMYFFKETVQGVFCPFGKNKSNITWEKFKKLR